MKNYGFDDLAEKIKNNWCRMWKECTKIQEN
jgi:hypothetical protein